MMRIVLLLSLAIFLLGTGCAKSLRYSAGEIKNFPPEVQEHIKNSEITPGMTMVQVRYAWGAPDSVTALGPDKQGREQVEWTYKSLQFLKTALLFTNDSLAVIESTEPGIIKKK